ncbi:uncharacterized protein J3R85_017573 [Psidium guajava]|nr:uncharacterized protein J3R85_017573 [Psidium guajava]
MPLDLHIPSSGQQKKYNKEKTKKIRSDICSSSPGEKRRPAILKKMDMKKISCAVLVAAASMSAVLASDASPAPAPGPSSGASAALPIFGSLVGASMVSFFAYYLQ